jgi:hypothetical protein
MNRDTTRDRIASRARAVFVDSRTCRAPGSKQALRPLLSFGASLFPRAHDLAAAPSRPAARRARYAAQVQRV